MSRVVDEQAWYSEGLAFECTRCGACCTGAPGYVWVDAEEIARLAEHRGLSVPAFSKAFVRRVGSRYSLVERPGGDCVFWDKTVGCTVYPARPAQCQTWPFWPENIESPEAWRESTRTCPGSNSGQGRVFTIEEIEASAQRVHTP
jgi:Fe-S-cluster containining protein